MRGVAGSMRSLARRAGQLRGRGVRGTGPLGNEIESLAGREAQAARGSTDYPSSIGGTLRADPGVGRRQNCARC